MTIGREDDPRATILNLRWLGYLILILMFFPFPRLGDELVVGPITNSIHLGIGALIYYLVSMRLRSAKNVDNKVLIFFLVSIAIAWLIESIQPIFGRSNSREDLILSFFGTLIATLAGLKKKSQWSQGSFFFVIFLGSMFALIPIIGGVRMYRAKWDKFPVLVSPGFVLNSLIIPVGGAEIFREFGDCSFLFLTNKTFAGIEIPLDREDWSKYSSLRIEIDNLSPGLRSLGLRIDDSGEVKEYGDRFNKKISLEKGNSVFQVPISEIAKGTQREDFSLEEIKRILLYSSGDDSQGAFCVRRVWLER